MSQRKKNQYSSKNEKPANQNTDPLSPREREVLAYLCHGNTYRQAAKNFNISEHTVRRHAHSAYKKLGVKNKTQAMIKYFMK